MIAIQAGIFFVLIFIPTVTNDEEYGLVFKCCGVYEQFDSSRRCVPAPWPPGDVDIGLDEWGVVSSGDETWTSRWYPPGPPRNRIVSTPAFVIHSVLSGRVKNSTYSRSGLSAVLKEYSLMTTVNQSCFPLDRNCTGGRSCTDCMHVHGDGILRRKPGNGVRFAVYCVDAIEGQRAPYLLFFRTLPTYVDHFYKCCKLGEVVVTKGVGILDCEADARAWTNPANASFSSHFDLETPLFVVSKMFKKVREFKLIHADFHMLPFAPDDVHLVKYLKIKQPSVEFLSSTWMYPCADLKREDNGDVRQVLGYFSITRRTRAAYLVSRHLPFVSALILLAALVAVCCKERMRSSAHGWSLACHVVCLLLFNVGQIVYSLTMSAEIETGTPMTPETERSCLGFAIPMYFLLTSANAWMTAVSANMFLGFKITGRAAPRGTRAGGGDRKRFLKLSAFAWSVAAALTLFSAVAFLNIAHDSVEKHTRRVQMLLWYRPTFTETRTCYSEVRHSSVENVLQYRSQKLGTILFYYLPTLALVAANATFLWRTGRRVRYLRRGNSLLKRDEREGGGRRKEGGRGGGEQKNKKSADVPKSVTVYIKLLLAGGVLEFLAEMLTWAMTSFQPWKMQPSESVVSRSWETLAELLTYQFKDHIYAHRTTGYWADLFRALVVLWLAVPERPDLRGLWRRMCGREGDSPAQGASARPAPRPVTRPSPRRGQQGGSL